MAYIINPKERGRVNRRRVLEYFLANPCQTNKACAKALDLNEMSVGRHARAIRDGWRPDESEADNGKS